MAGLELLRLNPWVVPSSRYRALFDGDARRLAAYQESLNWYEGRHWQTPRRGRSSLAVNYCRTIVDKGVSFLLGRGIGFAVEAAGRGPAVSLLGQRGPADEYAAVRRSRGADGRAEAAEAVLYDVYDANDLDLVDLGAATNAAVLGDAVYKVWWDAGAARIRCVSVDPLGFFAQWRGDDVAELQRVDVAYCLSAADARELYAGGGAARTDGLVEIVETWTRAAMRVEVGGRAVAEGPNPYGLIPFVHVPNLRGPNQFWGRSDLQDVIGLNREFNERMSDQADVIRYHADPPVVFRGVEDHDALRVGPGSVWDLPADADVHLLEWLGQPVAVQEHIEQVRRSMYETAETPRTAFGDSGRMLSGVALETELRPLIQKTLRKRVVWTVALRRRVRLIWALAEQYGLLPAGATAGLRARIIWPSMMPSDDAQEVQNQVTLVAAGLRTRLTAMDMLGTESPERELAGVRAEMGMVGPVQGVSGMATHG